jgi:hypothetical protein
MDKFIYRGMIILVCLVLAIILVITPILTKMYLDIRKTEIRLEKKLAELERRKDE